MIYKNKNFLITGVSKSGFSSAKLLISKGAKVFLYDDKSYENAESLKNMGACDVSALSETEILKDIYCIIKSPGVPREHRLIELALSRRIPVISEIELGWYNYKGVCLAITGTNGKSTVTALTDYIINSAGQKSFLCGNYGTPFTEYCLEPAETYCCVEVSSFQLENCFEFKPHIAAVLNITEDHMNRHRTMQNYINIKKRIFRNQKLTEYAVLNFDCLTSRQLFENVNSCVYWFSGKQKVKGAYIENGILKFCGEDIINEKDIYIAGWHNRLNCLAALCMAKILGIDSGVISHCLKSFKGIPHRLQFAGKAGNVSFYNDSKATNTDSTLTAIKAMKEGTILLLGGCDKGADLKPLMEEISRSPQIASCIFFGEMRNRLIAAAESVGYGRYAVCGNMEESVYKAYRNCGGYGAVLLSPGCASFDEFKNFEERGERFLAIVKDIINADKQKGN
jgi:UDP-N-acetylmuramoylalanine--D-glutamate ligase